MDAEMKRGQVTIFIILAILIVVGVIVLFALLNKPDSENPEALNPKSFVDKCVRDIVEDSLEIMLFNGGEKVRSHAIMYNGEEWNYLCYQADYYQGCYNIHPMLEMQIEKEIVVDTSAKIESCFRAMKKDFTNRGFDVSLGDLEYSIDLLPGVVDVNIDRNVIVSKDGLPQSFDKFDTDVVSPIYELVQIARDIVNSESQFCYFERNGYMLLYPEYDIRIVNYRESKIYWVTDRRSGDKLRFAVRSCAIPPGI